MDETTRRLIAEAYALDDGARESYEQSQSGLRQRSAPELVYKVHEDALVTPQPQSPEQDGEMDDLDQRIFPWIDETIKILCDGAAADQKAMREYVAEEIAKLRAELVTKSAANELDTHVAELPAFLRRRSDVA